MQHAIGCECKSERKKCPDVPKIIPPDGWQWDGSGDLGLWAVGLMSVGRHFMIGTDPDVYQIRWKSAGEVWVTARGVTGKRRLKRLSGDDIVYSMEAR